MKVCLATPVITLVKWSELSTKVLFGKKRGDLVYGVLFRIYDHSGSAIPGNLENLYFGTFKHASLEMLQPQGD